MSHAISSADDLLVGRRIATRSRIDLAGRYVCVAANVRVQVEDISSTGACMRLMRPQTLTEGTLGWLGFTHFGRVVWNDGFRCGLSFDEPVSQECLQRTVEFSRLSSDDAGDRFARLASAWAHGPGDW